MRGVSSIIAVILILMIVVSLVALTWTWFTRLFNNLASSASNATTTATTSLGIEANIEAAKFYSPTFVNATIRNTGTIDIDLSKLGIFVDGSFCPLYAPNSGKISPGLTATVNITNATAACSNKVLKITFESGFEDYTTITC